MIAFVAVTCWWLTQDSRVQASDDGYHTLIAFAIHDQLASGNLTGWFTEFNTYPPLAHLVGAIAVFIGGKSPSTVIVATNLVFVPLLAVSCYRVGQMAFGALGGVLAALFALGAPIFVSQMHMYMLDPAEAAMVAASVWALLASRRFEWVGVSAIAGAAVGLAMMTKSTSVIFLVGLVCMVLLRGGWRNWRGVLVFVVVAAVIALPWYVAHLHQLEGLVEGQGGTGAAPSAEAAPPVFSRASLLWYFWAALNYQLLAPLSLFLLVGVSVAIMRWVRGHGPETVVPELLAGLAVSWLGITMIQHKDMRFTLPALVYVAALGTGWITALRPRVRTPLIAVLGAVLLADFIGVSAGLGSTVRITLPGASAANGLRTRAITIYSPEGYVRGGPQHDGNILALMRRLKRAGVHSVMFDPASTITAGDFSTFGLTVRAIQAGLPVDAVYQPAALASNEAFMQLHVPQPGDPPPCEYLSGDRGVYISLGDALKPFQSYTFICPWRHPVIYRHVGPLSLEEDIRIHPEIVGSARTMVLNVLNALHREGVRQLAIDRDTANTRFFQPVGVERLAEMAQIPVPASLAPQAMTSSDAYLMRAPVARGGPKPCGRFPDRTGLYIVRGDPSAAHPRYRCPKNFASR